MVGGKENTIEEIDQQEQSKLSIIFVLTVSLRVFSGGTHGVKKRWRLSPRKDAARKKFTDAQLAEVGGLDYDHAMKTPRCSILFSASRTRRLTMAITVCVKKKPFCALHHVCSLCASPYDNNKKEALPHDKQKVT